MGREKRKGRLNKTGDVTNHHSGNFIGFGAFATTSSPALLAQGPLNPSTTARLSPIYNGSDPSLTLLFPKIGQKRDATTKFKALQELTIFFRDSEASKKTKAEALSHFLYLFQTKLYFDPSSKVRASAIRLAEVASKECPKAWKNLLKSETTTDEATSANAEILGMLVCAKADQASEVRAAAKDMENESGSEEVGTWRYVHKILSYNKPQDMHIDLFQKKGNNNNNNNAPMKLSEAQQEELEEKYERIVGTTIEGFRLFLVEHPESTGNFPSSKFLWKTLSSPKASLRRQTYSLLSTICQLGRTDFIDSPKMTKLLAQSLASEKDSSNVGILLETLVAFVASGCEPQERPSVMATFARPLSKLFKKGCHGAAPASAWTPTVLPLVALLPKETTSSAGLPLRVDVLTNIWEGRVHVVGSSDRCEVVRAVAETAAFLLAKEDSKATDDCLSNNGDLDIEASFDQVLAKCWSQALQTYLSTSRSNGGKNTKINPKSAIDALKRTLAKGWLQFDRASTFQERNGKLPSSIFHLQEWFWNEELPKVLLLTSTKDSNLKELLDTIRAETNKQVEKSSPLKAKGTLAKKFRALFPKTNDSGDNNTWVPNNDVYQLWIAILQVCPTALKELYPASSKSDLEALLWNQILSWIVIHTSSLSDRCDSELALLDIRLIHSLSQAHAFSNANVAIPFEAWWAPILREILAATPDIQILVDCLSWLIRNGSYKTDEVICTGGDGTMDSPFSKFCIRIAENAISMCTESSENLSNGRHDTDDSDTEASHSSEIVDESYCKTIAFLRACVGLDVERIPEPLVGDDVISAWVKCACPNLPTDRHSLSENPVLDTLVELMCDQKLQKTLSMERILLQSWRQGGTLWEERCRPWLLTPENTKYRSSLIASAGRELTDRITELSISTATSDLDDDLVWQWTERACRLLRLCSQSEEENDVARPSLAIVGLGKPSIWKTGNRSDHLSTCFLRLIRSVETLSSRWALFVHSDMDEVELLVTILMSLSSGSENPMTADFARRGKDRCTDLLVDIGFSRFETGLATSVINCCVSTLSLKLQESANDYSWICRGIAVLSKLIGLRFLPLRPEAKMHVSQEKLDPSIVQPGDRIWYIADKSDPFAQESCLLVKIHRDLPEEVYFTIRLDRDGVQQERQTIGERLRKTRSMKEECIASSDEKNSLSVNQIDDKEQRLREQIVLPILEKLISSIDAHSPSPIYEIFNIAIVQCGLPEGRGIGSAHYSVFQKLSALQNDLLESLSSPSTQERVFLSLWRLAFALGFGVNSSASMNTVELIGLNAADAIPNLLEYDGNEDLESTKEIESAMAAWLSVCAPTCDDPVLRIQSFSVLFDLASRLLVVKDKSETPDKSRQGLHHYLAMRAIQIGQIESHKFKEGESLIHESEAETLVELIKVFFKEGGSFDYAVADLFDSIICQSLRNRPTTMAFASRQCIGALSRSLFDSLKQKYAMLILKTYTNESHPLFLDADDDDLINPKTLELLDEWGEDLLEDEADELEDDVASVAQWVCWELMNSIETWHEDDEINDEIVCGRMLSWLHFLDIADAATGKDSVNRLAFTSYVTHCKAVDAMLDLALIYGNIGTERKAFLDFVVPMEEIMESMSLSKLAVRVIYRSVEVFPTLSKNWWDSFCPKYLTHTVKDFVEAQVSPDILKHAVQSIKNASAFGDMNVKGSSVTREVHATYVQDDFTLSVLIKLPLSFPFRRAEVDCSKTLGVPEHRWKRWSLQITQMLNNQGGTLKDALLLWKENVDKEFEGVEPCPVCYSVLHVKSHKLPNLECKTCHNQFHSDCLFEWFKNSGKSACVICQQPWSGTRIQ